MWQRSPRAPPRTVPRGGRPRFPGEDSFVIRDPRERQWPDSSFTIRFHLHPRDQGDPRPQSAAVTLLCRWPCLAIHGAGRRPPIVEDSIPRYGRWPEALPPDRHPGAAGRPDRVNWAFRKTRTPRAATGRAHGFSFVIAGRSSRAMGRLNHRESQDRCRSPSAAPSISVSDKTGLIEFARRWRRVGWNSFSDPVAPRRRLHECRHQGGPMSRA